MCYIYMFLNIFYKNWTKTEVAAQNPCDMNLKLINSRCHDTNVTHASITIGFVLLFLWTMIQRIYEPFPPPTHFLRPSRPRSPGRPRSQSRKCPGSSPECLPAASPPEWTARLWAWPGSCPGAPACCPHASWSTKTCIQIFSPPTFYKTSS